MVRRWGAALLAVSSFAACSGGGQGDDDLPPFTSTTSAPATTTTTAPPLAATKQVITTSDPCRLLDPAALASNLGGTWRAGSRPRDGELVAGVGGGRLSICRWRGSGSAYVQLAVLVGSTVIKETESAAAHRSRFEQACANEGDTGRIALVLSDSAYLCDKGPKGVALSFVVLDTMVVLSVPGLPGVDVPAGSTALGRVALERM